ncbi:MAG: protein kinase, partial [Planctomycetota bacterium]|nr:protein kinase [Planctomycetota bacterium]
MVHRDVKPGNIIVERQSLRPILVDFGIVRRRKESKIGEGSRFETSTSLTKTGEVHGTPAYMSPEQMESEQFGEVSEKSDVWGFGATLFHALTGIAPYERAGANIYLALIQKNPPRVQKINPEVPYWLDSICHRCLQKISGNRPGMSSILDDLLSPNRVAKRALMPFVLVFVLLVFASTATGVWAYLDIQHEELVRNHEGAHKAADLAYDQLNEEFRILTAGFNDSPEHKVVDLIEKIQDLETLQIKDESFAARLEKIESRDENRSSKELHRSLRAFHLVLQFHQDKLDPRSESSEKIVRLIKNESPRRNDFVQWAHALRLKKAEKWDESLEAFTKIRTSPELGTYALREMAALQFQLKNWKEADALAEAVLDSKQGQENRLCLILRRAIIQIRLKNRAVARVFLKRALKERVTAAEDRENALRLALFLGEVECFGRFLEGSSEQDKRRPYAAIAIVWHELKQGHRGEARHRLSFLPKNHAKRFLRAHSWLAKAMVQREFFELGDSTLSIEQALELNKQSQNTLIQLYCARVAISNLMTGDELASAMDALVALENTLPEDLDDIQTGLLADINLAVGDVARFNYLLGVSETGRNYMSYYKRALNLSRDPEILIRMALIALLKDQRAEADKLVKQMPASQQKSLNGFLLKAHYDWPDDRSSAKDPGLQRSLSSFVKSRETMRSPSLQRLQSDVACRVRLSYGRDGSLDTVVLQKYLNRCSEYNALDPKTAHLAWQLSSNLGFPGADVSARRLFFHLDPANSETWGTYALFGSNVKFP